MIFADFDQVFFFFLSFTCFYASAQNLQYGNYACAKEFTFRRSGPTITNCNKKAYFLVKKQFPKSLLLITDEFEYNDIV